MRYFVAPDYNTTYNYNQATRQVATVRAGVISTLFLFSPLVYLSTFKKELI